MKEKHYSQITIVNPKTIKKGSYMALAGTIAGISLVGYLTFSPLEEKASASKPRGQIIIDNDFMKEKSNDLERKFNISSKKTEEFSLEKLKKEPEKILFARMLFGEARDCNYAEKIMIGYTVLGRNEQWFGNSKELSKILLQPRAYSCFWENSKRNKINQKAIMNPEVESEEWKLCLKAVEDIFADKYPHLNKKQTFYHMKYMKKPKSWKGVKKLNFKNIKTKHVFYRD